MDVDRSSANPSAPHDATMSPTGMSPTAMSPAATAPLLRQSLVRAGRTGAAIQDMIDAAELQLAFGHRDAARLLYEVAFLQSGFSPDRIGWQHEAGTRTGLWGAASPAPPAPAPPAAASPAAPGIDRAVAELAALLTLSAGLPPLPSGDAARAHADRAMALPAADPARTDGARARDVAPVVRDTETMGFGAELYERLRAPLDAAAERALTVLLERMRARLLDAGPVRVVDHVAADVADLPGIVACDKLRDFLLANHDLAYPPCGSAALFHASARLHDTGLGPYLAHAAHIARDNRDIFGLVGLAAAAAGLGQAAAADADHVARWSVLLSIHLDAAARFALVDDLGDLGFLSALWRLLEGYIRAPDGDVERDMLARIRDAGLDHGDHALAAAAQHILALRRPADHAGWTVLGEIQASGGDYARAERSILTALALAPGDPAAEDRLRAIQVRQFDAFAVHYGLLSSNRRRQIRAARPPAASAPAARSSRSTASPVA